MELDKTACQHWLITELNINEIKEVTLSTIQIETTFVCQWGGCDSELPRVLQVPAMGTKSHYVLLTGENVV